MFKTVTRRRVLTLEDKLACCDSSYSSSIESTEALMGNVLNLFDILDSQPEPAKPVAPAPHPSTAPVSSFEAVASVPILSATISSPREPWNGDKPQVQDSKASADKQGKSIVVDAVPIHFRILEGCTPVAVQEGQHNLDNSGPDSTRTKPDCFSVPLQSTDECTSLSQTKGNNVSNIKTIQRVSSGKREVNPGTGQQDSSCCSAAEVNVNSNSDTGSSDSDKARDGGGVCKLRKVDAVTVA